MKYPHGNCIYVIGCSKMPKLYKIGKSKNINRRFKGYKTHNPHKMDILHLRYIDNMSLVENVLKTTLKPYHYVGEGGTEWYKCDNVNILIEEVENVAHFLERRVGSRKNNKFTNNFNYSIVSLIPLSVLLYYVYILTI